MCPVSNITRFLKSVFDMLCIVFNSLQTEGCLQSVKTTLTPYQIPTFMLTLPKATLYTAYQISIFSFMSSENDQVK